MLHTMHRVKHGNLLDFCLCISYNRLRQLFIRGFGVAATCDFPKVETTGSNPVTRFHTRASRYREVLVFTAPLTLLAGSCADAPAYHAYHVLLFLIQQGKQYQRVQDILAQSQAGLDPGVEHILAHGIYLTKHQ